MSSVDDEVQVRRFAIRFSPPTLAVEYHRSGKIHLLEVRLKRTPGRSDKLLKKLVTQYPEILGESNVCHDQLLDLIELLLSGGDEKDVAVDLIANSRIVTTVVAKESSSVTATSTDIPVLDSFGDLNAVSDEENAKAKAAMDVVFSAKLLRPGDPGFTYDKRVDFGPTEESNDWDEEDDG